MLSGSRTSARSFIWPPVLRQVAIREASFPTVTPIDGWSDRDLTRNIALAMCLQFHDSR